MAPLLGEGEVGAGCRSVDRRITAPRRWCKDRCRGLSGSGSAVLRPRTFCRGRVGIPVARTTLSSSWGTKGPVVAANVPGLTDGDAVRRMFLKESPVGLQPARSGALKPARVGTCGTAGTPAPENSGRFIVFRPRFRADLCRRDLRSAPFWFPAFPAAGSQPAAMAYGCPSRRARVRRQRPRVSVLRPRLSAASGAGEICRVSGVAAMRAISTAGAEAAGGASGTPNRASTGATFRDGRWRWFPPDSERGRLRHAAGAVQESVEIVVVPAAQRCR